MKNMIKKLMIWLSQVIGVKISVEKAKTKKWMVTVEYKVLGMTVMTDHMPLTDFIK